MVGSFLIGGATSCDERGQRSEEIEQRGDDREEADDGLHEASGRFFSKRGPRQHTPTRGRGWADFAENVFTEKGKGLPTPRSGIAPPTDPPNTRQITAPSTIRL